jgi:phage terminase large subunit-like protein
MTMQTISIDGHRYKYRLNEERRLWWVGDGTPEHPGFFPKYLVHVEDRFAGQPFVLLDWERELLEAIHGPEIFDPELDQWVRLLTEAYLEIPKKQGKSALGSGMGVGELSYPGNPPGIGIFSVAADSDQANLIFSLGRRMVEANPNLSKRIRSYRRVMEHKKSGRTWRVIPADADTNDGEKVSVLLFDELHRQRHRALYDVMTRNQSAATEPLTCYFTTAGDDDSTVCRQVHDYGEQIAAGSLSNPRFHYRRYGIEDGEDWEDEAVWKRANPSLGVTKTLATLRREHAKAVASPAEQTAFIRLHLNGWYHSEDRWLAPGVWEASQTAEGVDEEKLLKRECFAGLDLSSVADLTALVAVFDVDGLLKVVSRFWVPEDGLSERAKKDRVPYDLWVRDGWITATPGNMVDYEVMRADINAFADKFSLVDMNVDRLFQGAQLMTQLEGDGLTVVPFGQGFLSMTAPMKELAALLMSASASDPNVRLDHGGNPVLTWMAANVRAKLDEAGNIKPDKAKSRQRIDGIVALIMAIDRWARHKEDAKGPSIYATRGALMV